MFFYFFQNTKIILQKYSFLLQANHARMHDQNREKKYINPVVYIHVSRKMLFLKFESWSTDKTDRITLFLKVLSRIIYVCYMFSPHTYDPEIKIYENENKYTLTD